jgi:S1-C subfamily serine protease
MLTEVSECRSAQQGVTHGMGRNIAVGGQATGDVVIRIDNQDIKDFDDLANYIDSKEVGDTVDVVVFRDGQELTLSVILNAWQSS